MSKSAAPGYAGSSSSSEGSVTDLKGDEGWLDAEEDLIEENFISLLDDEVFSDVKSMLEHCKNKHNFDFLEVRQRVVSDFYDNIKLVNYIRSCIHSGLPVTSDISKASFADDKFLKPVLEDDALLIALDELPEVTNEVATSGAEGSTNLVSLVSELEEELRCMQNQFDKYRNSVEETLNERWNDKLKGPDAPKEEEKRDDDSHYFSSYSYNEIHEVMLKDTIRTDAYRDFIYNNKSFFAGKVVLDVGCGTGILSMFCAKAGAARVIAVDNSAIIDKARENIFNNGFADKITCLRGKVEEVILPVDKVDIIVSEWMGYCLLYEAMLDSVIWARDKYLKPDGLMVPSHMNLWVAPVADPDYISDHIAFWRDVYGFDMKAMQAGIHDDAQVLNMPSSTVCGEPFPFLQLSLHSTIIKDLVFKRKWETKLTKDIDALDGFIIWFDSFFMPSRDDKVPEDAKAEDWEKSGKQGVAFTTGPMAKETHWKQGVMLIDNTKERPAALKEGTDLAGELEYAVPEDNSRALNVSLTWKVNAEKENSQFWKMR
ncbi:S-adenosyl-L-methionine-dependent methyltransferase [Calycina marina]|uniref:type I protein arginine methyltransferase n=1 Tax=Calycina marina TaxID=1763456 RepID=A0A9P7Z4F6_9HELO|nr:S-adenosyl-L-methionine-dependent methyltransferase [Calycina marina]